MTRRTNAKVAGFTFLFYIAAAFSGMVLANSAASGEGTAAKLASIAHHASAMRLAIVLEMLGCFCALVLAVTLYAITREQDPDLAMLAMTCRVAEGVLNAAIGLVAMVGVLWLGTGTQPGAPDAAATYVLGAFLLKVLAWNPIIGATF